MPMDIRNFFWKKGGAAPAAAKKKPNDNEKARKTSSNDSNNAAKKTSSTSPSSAAKKSKPAASTKPSAPQKTKVAPAKKNNLLPMKEEKEPVEEKKQAHHQKKKIIFDSDDDSDATTDVDFKPASKSRKQGMDKKRPVVLDDDSDSDATTDAKEEQKPPAAVAPKKKKAPAQEPKRKIEVSASEFFRSSPSTKRSTPRNNSKPKKSYVMDDSDTDGGEDADLPARKASKSKVDDDEDFRDFDDQDDEEDLDVDYEPKKKRASPRTASKRLTTKPERKDSPAKKPKLDHDYADEEGFGDNDIGDNDDYKGNESKATPSRPKNKRAASSSLSRATPVAESSPPSTKKRRTQTSSKKPPAAKKEAPLEATLELDSFNVDDAVVECMAGTTFVFSGELEGLSREDASDFVKTLGARVTTQVSSKTTYLVVGELLEDGRPYTEGKKYEKASQMGTIIVKGEKRLFGLAKLYNDKAKALQPAHDKDKENNENRPSITAVKAAPAPAAAAVKPVSNPYAKKPITNPYAKKAVATTNPYAKAKPSVSLKSSAECNASPQSSEANALWVDKYAPTSTRDVLGNRENVSKLSAWLDRWESRFNNEKAVGKAFSSPQGPWKAALLSGPPGIGKTTTATLVAMEAGRDLIEFNASDVRSKKVMRECLGDITGSQSVEGFFQSGKVKGGVKSSPAQHRKRCIIFDEVDGMGAGDRGGMAELIQMIKHSRVPIICICNDRQSQKMKSLLP
jgi:replication factor C subunit 1